MITSRHVTGEWVHIVDDGMVDEDALPDEARPTGHVIFTPLWPDVAAAGDAAYTLTPIHALIAEGQLRDVQGREGVWLAGAIGESVVRWQADTHLEFRGEPITYPRLVFDLEDDAKLTGLLQSDGPGELPWVVDPRIEGLVADAQQVLSDAQAVVAGLEGLEADAEGHAGSAMASAGEAAGYASAADQSAGAAAGSASSAAGSASAASSSAGQSEASRSAAVVAQGASESAATDAGLASDAAEADAVRAERAANDFDLTGSGITGLPGSEVSVTVTGDGPAYHLEIAVPEGIQGIQGEPGEVSQAALDAAVATLVDGAPAALDTLDELASALGNDPNFATTVSTEIGLRAKTTDVNAALAGKSDVGHTHTTAQVTGLDTALAGKANTSHSHTKAQVGLGNVDNTSDAAKPVSTATQQALDGKEPVAWSGTQAQYDALGSYDSDRTYYVEEE